MRQSFLIYVTILALAMAGAPASRAQTFQTKAPYAFLTDYNTGTVLFQKTRMW
jgi:D-alanyl-D-alanine carboxypeptidase